MAKRKDYADDLRDALLGLALIPVAGLKTTSFWFKESLDRTSALAAKLVTGIALARWALHGKSAKAKDPVADVLAHDVLDAARVYVRSMVSLPGDSAIYFTGEFERTFSALLLQIQPDAETDLGAYVARELNQLLEEADRLSLIAGTEVGREEARRRGAGGRREGAQQKKLLEQINSLRTRVEKTANDVESLTSQGTSDDSRSKFAEKRLLVLESQNAGAALQGALRGVETLLRKDKVKLARRIRGVIQDLGRPAPSRLTPRRRRSAHGQAKKKP